MTEMYKGRHKSALALATVLSLTLGGCSSVKDVFNPVEWYSDSVAVVGGWFDDSGSDISGDTGSYPNVSSVPDNPTPHMTSAERADIKNELVADRANAQYADIASTPSIADAGKTSPAEFQSNAPAASSPRATTEEGARQKIEPPQMTGSDEATRKSDARVTVATPSPPPPSQAIIGSGGASPRSSLWPNAPVPESMGDRPVTSARVGEPTARNSQTYMPRTETLGPRYRRLISNQRATVTDEGVSPGSSDPATILSAEEPTPAPPVLSIPESAPANFDEPSVIVDESVLTGNLTDYALAGGNSYQAAIIRFGNGSARLFEPDLGVIRELVPLILNNNAIVEVVGHASSRTRNMDPLEHKLINFEISLSRANAVAQALINAGVPSDRISVAALSDSQPVSSEAMPAGEAENRRAEIYLIY